jgi:hypothetical protein
MSVTGIQEAVEVLEGKTVPTNYSFPITMYEYPKVIALPATPSTAGWSAPVYTLDKKGVTAVTGLSAEFSFPYLAPGFNYSLTQLEAAM